MVDKLCSASPAGATTSLFISSTNMFCHQGHIAEAGIIEHMAQSASAMAGYNCKVAGKPAPVGFIGEVKKFTLNFLPKIEETIKTSVKIVSDSKGSALINATATVGGEVAATCMMKFFIKGA